MKRNKKRKKINKLRLLGLCIIGIAMIIIAYSAYHIYSANYEIYKTLAMWNNRQQKVLSKDQSFWDKEIKVKGNLDNDQLTSSQGSNKQTTEEIAEPHSSLIQYEEVVAGEIIGQLTYNDKSLPIVTGTQESLLKKGVLHYGDTILPGLEGNSILLGHRDVVFGDLGQLDVNASFTITTVNNTLQFQVIDIRILQSDDLSVFDTYGYPTVSLVTCYPFHVLASKSERYVVTGKLVP